MKWNRNPLEVNVIVLLVLAGICLSAFPWKNDSVACFQPMRYSDRVLVIDAGHGGEDGGAVSVTGTPESGINLAIALKLDDFCGLFGVEHILTRSTDASLKDADAQNLAQMKRTDLNNRVALIEETSNAVLVSIHQNYFTIGTNTGAQVFYAPTQWSEAWAYHCQQLLVSGLDPNNHRQSKAISDGIYLMSHVSCPAILVECGFLSDREEAEKLETVEYQTKLALTILSAYMTFSFQ